MLIMSATLEYWCLWFCLDTSILRAFSDSLDGIFSVSWLDVDRKSEFHIPKEQYFVICIFLHSCENKTLLWVCHGKDSDTAWGEYSYTYDVDASKPEFEIRYVLENRYVLGNGGGGNWKERDFEYEGGDETETQNWVSMCEMR